MLVKTAYNNEELDNIFNEGEVGDLIDYAPENQEGLVHYEIIEQNGVKELKKIGDYFSDMSEASSIRGGKRSHKKSHKKLHNKNGTLRKLKRPCCKTTLEGLHEWYREKIEQFGWMILAKIHGNTDKINFYLHSIHCLEDDIKLRLTHIRDPDNKHDLEVMLHNINLLCEHAEKDLK